MTKHVDILLAGGWNNKAPKPCRVDAPDPHFPEEVLSEISWEMRRLALHKGAGEDHDRRTRLLHQAVGLRAAARVLRLLEPARAVELYQQALADEMNDLRLLAEERLEDAWEQQD